MTPLEIKAATSLAAIYGLRLFGMFIILPVFALWATDLPGWDKAWVGFAMGVYGFTQAILQVPFGWLSDRIGRKPVLYVGLTIMAAGSFLCAMSTSVAGVVAGRMLQGAGAISSVTIAMTADLTRESQRTKAMAMIGLTIGLAFALSFVIAPFLAASIGVQGIFALTGLLALSAIAVVRLRVPDAQDSGPREPVRWSVILTNGQLMRLNFGMFSLHAILMALFLVVPFDLTDAGLAARDHWMLYLGVIVLSLVLVAPIIRSGWAETRIVSLAAGLMALCLAALALLPRNLWAMAGTLTLFFAAFNLLEAKLPALISVRAPAGAKGSASGVFASLQFLGIFSGATAGGLIAEKAGNVAVLWFCVTLSVLWFIAALGVEPVRVGTQDTHSK
jgi:predicted MFS family arabinose efflux permease